MYIPIIYELSCPHRLAITSWHRPRWVANKEIHNSIVHETKRSETQCIHTRNAIQSCIYPGPPRAVTDKACHPGGHYRDFLTGNLSFNQVTTTWRSGTLFLSRKSYTSSFFTFNESSLLNILQSTWFKISVRWPSFLTLNVRGPSYLGLTGQYHGCWCPGSLRRQDISSHDIDCRICRSWSYLRKHFKYLCHIDVE